MGGKNWDTRGKTMAHSHLLLLFCLFLSFHLLCGLFDILLPTNVGSAVSCNGPTSEGGRTSEDRLVSAYASPSQIFESWLLFPMAMEGVRAKVGGRLEEGGGRGEVLTILSDLIANSSWMGLVPSFPLSNGLAKDTGADVIYGC